MTAIAYDPTILQQFPHSVAGVLFIQNIANTPTQQAMRDEFEQTQEKVKAQIGTTPLSQIPSIAAWRTTFSAFGSPPTKYRNAAEALLRRLTKKGSIPSINMLVDIGNMVSIRHALPVAIFDTRTLQGTLTIRFATGSESYTDFSNPDPISPETGEVIFVDEAEVIFARRWCWKQSAQSAISIDTHNAIIITEAQHDTGLDDVTAALEDLKHLLQHHCQQISFTSSFLSADTPAFQSN